MKKYYFVSWNAGNGIYCTNLTTAESAADVYKAYAERCEVTVSPAEDHEYYDIDTKPGKSWAA